MNKTPYADQIISLARSMLLSGPMATPPRSRAVRKMVGYLLENPLHKFTQRHQRGSWRRWPTNIGNLKEIGRLSRREI